MAGSTEHALALLLHLAPAASFVRYRLHGELPFFMEQWVPSAGLLLRSIIDGLGSPRRGCTAITQAIICASRSFVLALVQDKRH